MRHFKYFVEGTVLICPNTKDKNNQKYKKQGLAIFMVLGEYLGGIKDAGEGKSYEFTRKTSDR
jgi:hypothetical protein